MPNHRVTFLPSGRSALVAEGATILDASRLAAEPLRAECGGRGACGRCLVQVVEGQVPEYRVLRRESGLPQVLACVTQVRDGLTILPAVEKELPRLVSHDRNVGVAPLAEWAPWALELDSVVSLEAGADLGVAVDVGTTTLRLLLVRLSDGVVVGEAGAYNPQILSGADVISRIVAAEKGLLSDLAASVRNVIREMICRMAEEAHADPGGIRGYMVAGNLTMIHLLLGVDPSGIRRVPSEPRALAFDPVQASDLGWPGRGSVAVHSLPAAGGWVGADIIAGIVRAGFSRSLDGVTLYVDLGTNGEIALGGREFALTCACSAGPAFEGGGIQCGMRADRGAIDGARIDREAETLQVSVIGAGEAHGVCGSGLIALTDALFRAGWIDRSARFTGRLPSKYRIEGPWGVAAALTDSGKVALWERDLASLVRAKGAIFAGIRSVAGVLGEGGGRIERVIVSGNFGRYLNLPAALGIGLLPDLPLGCYSYVDNGSLEGAALALLSREFLTEVTTYLRRVTYVNLSELPGYMDEFVGACFLPHTSPELLRV
jgi:uncharacterized 2Fe-2S/4Fe-4S cluster protein (DUF4445 family)